jgi:hypothetical protein
MLLDGRRIEDVSKDDLQALVDLKVREGKALEFKRDLPRTDRIDFAADVSALANTAGGWIILGMDEEGGVAKALVGLTGEMADKAILRLQQVLDSRLDPRVVGVHLREIPLAEGRFALVVRVPRSWSAPHLVTNNDSYRGYIRGSRGNTLLDVEGLRNAFAAADAIPERLRSFRAERMRKMASHDVTVGFGDAAVVVIHVVPLGILTSSSTIDLHRDPPLDLVVGESPLFLTSERFNLEGRLRYSEEAYLQIFRSGALELAYRYSSNQDRKLYLGIDWFFIKEIGWLLRLGRFYDLEPPFAVMVSLLGFKGFRFALDFPRALSLRGVVNEVDRQEILLPDFLIDQVGSDLKKALKPLLDMVWNCAGFRGSLNFDEKGDWVGEEYR